MRQVLAPCRVDMCLPQDASFAARRTTSDEFTLCRTVLATRPLTVPELSEDASALYIRVPGNVRTSVISGPPPDEGGGQGAVVHFVLS